MKIRTCKTCKSEFAAAGSDKVCNRCVDGWNQDTPLADNVAYVIAERFDGLDSEQAQQALEVLNGTTKTD
ncbi:hypothetical protein ACQVRV_00370 (plasmid) [Ralstonia pseudosolanacearum]